MGKWDYVFMMYVRMKNSLKFCKQLLITMKISGRTYQKKFTIFKLRSDPVESFWIEWGQAYLVKVNNDWKRINAHAKNKLGQIPNVPIFTTRPDVECSIILSKKSWVTSKSFYISRGVYYFIISTHISYILAFKNWKVMKQSYKFKT